MYEHSGSIWEIDIDIDIDIDIEIEIDIGIEIDIKKEIEKILKEKKKEIGSYAFA